MKEGNISSFHNQAFWAIYLDPKRYPKLINTEPLMSTLADRIAFFADRTEGRKVSYIKTPLTYDELAISALCLSRYLPPPLFPHLTPPTQGRGRY